LGDWARTLGLSAPWHSPNNSARWQIANPRGNLYLDQGSQIAHWNGLELWLGFAPQIAGHSLLINSLDAEKSFVPLLNPTSPASQNRIVVIDPGHGGREAGTRCSVNDHWEKEYTLDWALRLKPLLEARGWTVFLTRQGDQLMDLADRVAFADSHHAARFVSLHFNSADPSISGTETYCVTPAGMRSTLTRGFEDDPALVFPNNAFDPQNLQLAMRLQQSVVRVDGATDRGVRHARFMTVLRGQKCPAVLIEGGYLSNHREAQLIATAGYRQKLADAVARSLD
jgi:N-acetylmuramoyl-L-alanine amidase